MKLLIDGQETGMIGRFGNLEDLLSQIALDQDRHDRIIWDVMVNGENYNETTPHDARDVMIDSIQSLEVGTKDKSEISDDFIRNSGDMFQILTRSAEEIAGLFRKADEGDANQRYLEFLASYQDMFQMLLNVKTVLNLPMDDKLEAFESLLDKMIGAQENQDWVMLADLLEYELVPVLKEWEDMFKEFERKDETVH